MTKIVFYGASVTQQRNGYVNHFAKLSKAKVLKFGFGGMHLNDAGICFIDKVVELKPEICFVDWFSTAYSNQDSNLELYIDAIAEKLLKVDCRVIFLFLPNKRNAKECDWENLYSFAKNYLKKQGLEFICIDEALSDCTPEEILRDEIHSTEKGSRFYAETIYDYLQNHPQLPKAEVKPNIYSSISALPVKRGFDKELILEGECHIQGFHLQIGPWSGIVNIKTDDGRFKENTWDWWCYYGRDHFSFNLPLNGKALFTVSDEKFDTTSCKENVDFSKYKKKLVIHEIYYYGGSLKLCTKGSRFSYLYTLLMSEVFAVKHRLRVIFKTIFRG